MSSTPSKPEGEGANSVDLYSLDLYQLLELFILVLSEQAWRYMGLRADPRTREISRNFEKAHVAIDCVISIVEKLETHLTVGAINRLRNIITDLQLNYARQLTQK